MGKNNARCSHPEAMASILLKIIEQTPRGGATIEELAEAYEAVKGVYPSRKTIYRALERLELLFDPLAREEPVDEDLPGPPVRLRRKKRNQKTYYLLEGEQSGLNYNLNESLYAALCLYPQHRGLLRDTYRRVLRKLLAETLAGVSVYNLLINEIETHVLVAEPAPADPVRFSRIVSDIFRALRYRQCLRIKYLRTYDGRETERIVEPYGLLSRFNNYYLAAYCRQNEAMRLFHLVHIRELTPLKDTTYIIPRHYSLQKAYGEVWATWTGLKGARAEKVVLHINRGAAERFRALRFHESQVNEELEGGSLAVTFKISGAGEMIPWLAGWGAEVRVIQPEWLRAALLAYLGKTMALYDGVLENS